MSKYIITEDQKIKVGNKTYLLKKGDVISEEYSLDDLREALGDPVDPPANRETKDSEIIDDDEPGIYPDLEEEPTPKEIIPEIKESKYKNYYPIKIPKSAPVAPVDPVAPAGPATAESAPAEVKLKTRQKIISKIKEDVIKPFIQKTQKTQVKQQVIDSIKSLLDKKEWTEQDTNKYYKIFKPSEYIEGKPSIKILKQIVYPAIKENNNIIESHIIIIDDIGRWTDYYNAMPFKTIDPYALSKVDISLWPSAIRPKVEKMDLKNKWPEYININLKIGRETQSEITPFAQYSENYEKLLIEFKYAIIYFKNSPLKSIKLDYLNFLKQYLKENSRSIIKKDQINNFIYLVNDNDEYSLRDIREEPELTMVLVEPIKLQPPKSFGRIAGRRPMDLTADTTPQKLINAINDLFAPVGPKIIHNKKTNQEKYEAIKNSNKIDYDVIIELEETFNQLSHILDGMGNIKPKFQNMMEYDDSYLLALYRVLMNKLNDNEQMIPNKIEFEYNFNQEPKGIDINIPTRNRDGQQEKVLQIDVKPLWKIQYEWLLKIAKHQRSIQPKPKPVEEIKELIETIVTKPGKLMTEAGEIELSVTDKLIISDIKKLKLKQK